MDSGITPFKGRRESTAEPMTVLYRFARGTQIGEIKERKVLAFAALEFFVFVDGELRENLTADHCVVSGIATADWNIRRATIGRGASGMVLTRSPT